MNLRRDVFQAVADQTRRTILQLLVSKSMTAGAIASHFDSSRPTISKHVQILLECELIEKEKIGRKIYYSLNPQKLKPVSDFIEPFQGRWEESRENNFEEAIKKFKSTK